MLMFQIKRETDVIDQRFSRKRNRNRNKRSVGGELKRSVLLDTNTGVDKVCTLCASLVLLCFNLYHFLLFF